MTDNLKRAEECGARLTAHGLMFNAAELDLYTAKVIEEAMKWQPIDTAPKDGKHILLYYPERNCCIRGAWLEATDGDWETGYKKWMEWQVDDELYIGDEGYVPTHWMPLPTPPQGE